MPLCWKFEHEDDADARTVMSIVGALSWEQLHGPQLEYAVGDAIEAWAEAEMGSWQDGDLVKVVVLSPKNMAGTYYVTLARSCSAVAYKKQHETL